MLISSPLDPPSRGADPGRTNRMHHQDCTRQDDPLKRTYRQGGSVRRPCFLRQHRHSFRRDRGREGSEFRKKAINEVVPEAVQVAVAIVENDTGERAAAVNRRRIAGGKVRSHSPVR